MHLIAQKLGKNDKYDRLTFVRADSSKAEISMPRQGILPHDLVHFVVESRLPFRHGFLSLVARGAEPTFAMQQAHEPGNPSVGIETAQVEAIVEALQTQLWSGQFVSEDFIDGMRTACVARDCPSLDFSLYEIESHWYVPALALQKDWAALPYFSSLSLEFAVDGNLPLPASAHSGVG